MIGSETKSRFQEHEERFFVNADTKRRIDLWIRACGPGWWMHERKEYENLEGDPMVKVTLRRELKGMVRK